MQYCLNAIFRKNIQFVQLFYYLTFSASSFFCVILQLFRPRLVLINSLPIFFCLFNLQLWICFCSLLSPLSMVPYGNCYQYLFLFCVNKNDVGPKPFPRRAEPFPSPSPLTKDKNKRDNISFLILSPGNRGAGERRGRESRRRIIKRVGSNYGLGRKMKDSIYLRDFNHRH